MSCTVKPVSSSHSKIDKIKILMTNGSLMKVESIAECPKRAFSIPVLLSCIKLPSVFKTFALPIFEWLLKTGFTVMLFYVFGVQKKRFIETVLLSTHNLIMFYLINKKINFQLCTLI